MTTINNNNYICIALCILSRSKVLITHNVVSVHFRWHDEALWMAYIHQGTCRDGPTPFIFTRSSTFFSSYYVFNLEYPTAGSSTLEFIQRYFIKITFNLVIHIIVQASNSMIVLRSKMLTNEVHEASLVRPSWSRELIQFRSADQSGFLHMLCWQIPAGPITAIYLVLLPLIVKNLPLCLTLT